MQKQYGVNRNNSYLHLLVGCTGRSLTTCRDTFFSHLIFPFNRSCGTLRRGSIFEIWNLLGLDGPNKKISLWFDDLKCMKIAITTIGVISNVLYMTKYIIRLDSFIYLKMVFLNIIIVLSSFQYELFLLTPYCFCISSFQRYHYCYCYC